MIKITGKLRLLALCLSLVVGIALAPMSVSATGEESETSQAQDNQGQRSNKVFSQPQEGSAEADNKDGSDAEADNKGDEVTEQPKDNPEEPEKAETQSKEPQPPDAAQNPAPVDQASENTRTQEQLNTRENERDNNKSDNIKSDEPGIFHSIFTIVPGLLIVLCIIALWKHVYGLKQRLRAAEDQLKKITPPKSEGFAELRTNRPKENLFSSKESEELRKIEERLTALEQTVRDIVNLLNRREEQSTKIPQQGFPRTVSTATNTLPQAPQLNKGALIHGDTIGAKPIPEPAKSLQDSSKIKDIVTAFNEMMRKPATTTMSGLNMRQQFMKDYKVIAFKCVNFEERVNRPEDKPRFATCTTSESTLWGVPLQDDTSLAVLPGLRNYESTAHDQGGLKELFESGYTGGSYRKIEVIEPAIVTRDFQIIKRGKLRLSHY